jgi:hypothetical protein
LFRHISFLAVFHPSLIYAAQRIDVNLDFIRSGTINATGNGTENSSGNHGEASAGGSINKAIIDQPPAKSDTPAAPLWDGQEIRMTKPETRRRMHHGEHGEEKKVPAS